MTLKDIAIETKLSPYRVEYYLRRLLAAGKIVQRTYVVYTVKRRSKLKY